MSGGVWLVRHGALPPDPEGRMVGARDIALSATGRAQARALARGFMPGLRGRLCAVITSDLSRCRETADLLLEHFEPVPLHVEPGLREISLGRWEGLTREEIEIRWPGAHAARGRDMGGFVPPGGESFAAVQRRALDALARWRQRHPQGTLLCVAHAGVLRVLLARYLALPLDDVLRIPQHYACRCFLPEW